MPLFDPQIKIYCNLAAKEGVYLRCENSKDCLIYALFLVDLLEFCSEIVIAITKLKKEDTVSGYHFAGDLPMRMRIVLVIPRMVSEYLLLSFVLTLNYFYFLI